MVLTEMQSELGPTARQMPSGSRTSSLKMSRIFGWCRLDTMQAQLLGTQLPLSPIMLRTYSPAWLTNGRRKMWVHDSTLHEADGWYWRIQEKTRLIIFVGHSLGGIVIKQVGAPDHTKAAGSHGLLGAISSKDRATISSHQRGNGWNYIFGDASPWKW
jgi:hypothetical protein